jgi:hypothetical protein
MLGHTARRTCRRTKRRNTNWNEPGVCERTATEEIWTLDTLAWERTHLGTPRSSGHVHTTQLLEHGGRCATGVGSGFGEAQASLKRIRGSRATCHSYAAADTLRWKCRPTSEGWAHRELVPLLFLGCPQHRHAISTLFVVLFKEIRTGQTMDESQWSSQERPRDSSA